MCIELAALGKDSIERYFFSAVFFGIPTVKVVIFLSCSGKNGKLSVFLRKEHFGILFSALVIEVNLLLTKERKELIYINILYILLKLFAKSIKGFFCLIDLYFFVIGNRKLCRKCSDKLFNGVYLFKVCHSCCAFFKLVFKLFADFSLIFIGKRIEEAFCVVNIVFIGIYQLFGGRQCLDKLRYCAGASDNGDGIDMRNNGKCIVARHGRPCRIAAGYIDYVALFYGDGFAAGIIIIGGRSVLVKVGSCLECFVACGIAKGYSVLALVHGKEIAHGFFIESRSKGSVGCGKLFQRGIGVAFNCAADISAVCAGIHNAYAVACFKSAVCNGKFAEAVVGEPVVERAHPAGGLSSAELAESVYAGNVVVLCTDGGIAVVSEGFNDAAHHG